MATDIRKTTTANIVKEKYCEIRNAARKLQQLAKEVYTQLLSHIDALRLLIYRQMTMSNTSAGDISSVS